MKFPKEYLEEIKQRVKVSDIVGATVQLKRRGREFVGLSPFSKEKTPSFTINDEKGFYHCFSSGEHGNIFDFLVKVEKLNFGDAVRKLAAKAGMPVFKFTKENIEVENKRKKYDEILTIALGVPIRTTGEIAPIKTLPATPAPGVWVNSITIPSQHVCKFVLRC